MAIVEGRWDCPSCGRRANRGHDVHCPGCGKPRGADVKFYLPENPEEVRDAEKLAEAKSGPDWICAFCQGSNRATSAHCTGCGASRENGTPRAAAPSPAPPKEPGEVRPFTAIAVVAVIAALIAWALLTPPTVKGTGGPFLRIGAPRGGSALVVIGKHMGADQKVEKNGPHAEKVPCAQAPEGVDILERKVEEVTRSTCSIPRRGPPLALALFDAKDLGNGYFDTGSGSSSSGSSGSDHSSSGSGCRDVVVHEEMCTYRTTGWYVDRWTVVDSTSAILTLPTAGPDERIVEEASVTELTVRSADGETFTIPCSEDEFLKLNAGDRIAGIWGPLGGLRRVTLTALP